MSVQLLCTAQIVYSMLDTSYTTEITSSSKAKRQNRIIFMGTGSTCVRYWGRLVSHIMEEGILVVILDIQAETRMN